MAWVVKCFCGTAIRGADDEQIVRKAQDHAKSKHALTVTREQVLGMAEKDSDPPAGGPGGGNAAGGGRSASSSPQS
jgi:predicted small metal-binding protein